MQIHQFTNEAKWSKKYKSSIDCNNPKGFSQKAHCAGKNKTEATNQYVLTPHQNLPNTKSMTGGTTMVTKSFKKMQQQQANTQAAVDARQGAGMSRIGTAPKVSKSDFSKNIFPTVNKKPRLVNSVLEGYKLQLERGRDMDVLHITDTKTGRRTEVRGKPDYERAYDENDPLHQLLDRIGKAANISELINGEPVGINPNHPDGERAKKDTDKAFNERKLTKKEIRKRDKLIDKLPASEFKKRYGKDWESVMYGTATKMAKK